MSSGFETDKITIVLHSFNFFGVLVLELARTVINKLDINQSDLWDELHNINITKGDIVNNQRNIQN